MAPKIKIGWSELTIEERFTLSRTVESKLTNNPDFPTTNPTLATLSARISTADSAKITAETKRQEALAATTAFNLAMDLLGTTLNEIGADVEKQSGGNPVKMQNGGFTLRATPAPINDIAVVTNLSVSNGDDDGEIDLQWDKVRGAKAYEIQINTDPNNAALWTNRSTVTKSKATLTGLASGVRTWFRVRAIGSAVNGGWSDPAVKTVS